jgi:stage II sporulation protein D
MAVNRRGRKLCAWAGCAIGVSLASAAPGFGATLFLVQGGGWGHGVGMGQWGAEGFARHGWNDRQILAHYYPHTTLTTMKMPTIRILLAQKKLVTIGSRKPFLLIDARGRTVHERAGTIRLGTALRVAKQRLVPPVRIEPGAAALAYGGRGYRGSLTLLRAAGKLSVVNDVGLELYLRGVVPSEMPRRWLPAAYEAQAIAARTYALAEMRRRGTFDLYDDSRDQVYGGIAAERPATNAAVGATTGQVLTYDGKPILAYYSSSTGGRTEAVEDAFPGRQPEPYLVSVSDPYDTISPFHRWHVRLRLVRIDRVLGFATTDVLVEHDAAGHASEVELLGPHGTKLVTGEAFSEALGLRSDRFSIDVLSLSAPTPIAAFAQPFALSGFVRGTSGVSLQRFAPNGTWQLAGRVHTASDGRFTITVRPRLTTSYRLVVDHVAGPSVAVDVVPRLSVRANGDVMSGTIRPSVPLQVEQQVGDAWRVVAHLPVGPSGHFETTLHTGRYRISSSASRQLASATSPSVSIPR